MSIQDLGSIGELIASIGVIITLIYLASQLKQNTKQLKRSELNATHDQFSYWRHAIIENDNVAELWRKATADEKLSEAEYIQFHFLMHEAAWAFSQWWDRSTIGAIAATDSELAIAGFRGLIDQSPATRNWWDENKAGFLPEFAQRVDESR